MTDTSNGAAEAATEQSDATLDDALSARYDELTEEAPTVERDERGRFKSAKAEEEAGHAETGEAEGEEPADEEQAAEGEEEGDDGSGPPAHLPQSLKDAWKEMPESARQAVAAHQQDMDRKFSQQGRMLQAVKPISDRLNQAVQQYPQFLNMTPDELAEGALRLAAVQHELENDPVNTVLKVAQQYGILEHVRSYFNGQHPSNQDNYIAQLQREIRDLKSSIEKGHGSLDDRISSAMAERETASVVQQFAAEQPHWADVEPHLPQFIAIVREQQPEAAPAQVLQAAYDMAIHAIPEVRAKVVATDKAATKPDPERARKAKKATSTNVRSTSTGSEKERTMDEVLSATYDRLQAG